MSDLKPRVRFAPSPTGYLHVGGARTALFNWLFAKNQGGSFIIRVEDTDQERSTEEYLKQQLKELRWLGLDWDEGPMLEGAPANRSAYGPYRQSERLHLYKKYAQQLIESGEAFYCFQTDEFLEKYKEDRKLRGLPPHYDRDEIPQVSLEEAKERIARGENPAIRFKAHREAVTIRDRIRGQVSFGAETVGDFVILRSNGMPTYNFACVVDDHLMEITHVLRGEDHLSNTLRQDMLYRAFSWKAPAYVHISMILGEDRQKLSKRHGATAVSGFEKEGFLPEALVNFLALLGWNPGDAREIMSLDELVESFSLKRLNPAAAVFDRVKLSWMNAQYIRQMEMKDLAIRARPFFESAGYNLKEKGEAWFLNLLKVTREACETLVDFPRQAELFLKVEFSLDEKAREVLSWEETALVVEALEGALSSFSEEISEDNFSELQNIVKERSGQKGKKLFMPMRVATTGEASGPELKLAWPLLGKDKLKKRVSFVKREMEQS
jgi:glutamyl-tRNA synthetase